jgi:hypothetical protein
VQELLIFVISWSKRCNIVGNHAQPTSVITNVIVGWRANASVNNNWTNGRCEENETSVTESKFATGYFP